MKTINQGEMIPHGFSRVRGVCGDRLQLRLPIFAWHCTRWAVFADVMRPGWWAFNVLIRSTDSGFNVRFGWELVKQTGPDVERFRSRVQA